MVESRKARKTTKDPRTEPKIKKTVNLIKVPKLQKMVDLIKEKAIGKGERINHLVVTNLVLK